MAKSYFSNEVKYYFCSIITFHIDWPMKYRFCWLFVRFANKQRMWLLKVRIYLPGMAKKGLPFNTLWYGFSTL